jgi:hypothetical protein
LDAVRLERIFLRYEPKVVSSDSCTYTGLVQDQIATQLLGQQWSESTPMVVRGDGNCPNIRYERFDMYTLIERCIVK